MAALLWTFIITYFGNTICVNNASSNQVNVTHIVSKDTFVFDKAFNLTGSKENATSAAPQVSSTEQSANVPVSDGGVGTETSTFNTPLFKTTEASTFTSTDLQTTETSLSPTEGILVTANPKTEGGGISSLSLPLSGSLPQPVTEVSAVCPCNVQRERCDINCCCDPDCTQELALFTQCSVQKVVGYTPQVGCELEEKERFWSELDEVMESIPTGERVVIGADFNGHVGEGNTGDEEVMGKFGVKERNLEGQMVVDFAKRMDMGVVNTYFQKREEHRVTYKSGGRRTQVDYILCRRGNLKEISDCKVVVGESVARQHRMVVCRMTLMVCKTKRSKIEKKTKWWKLKKEECCEEFRQKLRQALGGQVVLPDDWETTAEVIRETGRKVLGVSSGRRKEDKETWWWNEEVQDSIQRKRLAKKKWDMDRTEENRQEYKELQRRVKREVSKAKQKAYEELYTRLDTREGEKDLYRLARQRDRDGKDVQQVRVIKDRDGRVLTSEESVQRRWKEYFEELMNEENEREKRVEGVNSVEQKVDKIRKDEVRKALKRMKSGKALGPDDIPVEDWKCLGEAAVEFLANLFNRVLESERMPEEWRRSVLVPIFKNKGDVQSCSNYRGIKLMSHTMKVWERVVEARLRKVVEICEQQYGFMPRKSTTDAIFALRILMEKYRDGQKELHCVFVDLEKAYDRVPREELWYCMRKSGVAETYVRVMQDMYERSRTVVRCAVGQTEEFNVEVGLHQGSALSPFLFAIVMDQLSEEVRQESPWTMMFADDIVICSESREQVEENLERWRFALERRGMKVNCSKTEYMCVNEREGSGTVRLQGEEVKKVQEFKYLGSTVQSNGECGKEVKKRVQAGWNGWRKVSGVLCDQKISARIKGKVYRTVVRPAMLYGLETVSLRKRQESELEVAELKMLSGDTKLCSQDAALYTLTVTPEGLSQVMTSVQREINPDVFCIQSANYEQGLSFVAPAIPTESNFDSLFDRFVGFFFRASSRDGRTLQTPAQGKSPGYVYGDLIQTMDEAQQRGFFRLPASAAAANCLDTNPAAFLKDQTSRCVRSFTLQQDCTLLDALNLEAYTNFRVFSGKDNDANLVSVEVETVTLQSLEGTHTLVQTVAVASDYTPVLNGEICNQVVLQVKYTVRFGDAGQIVTVTASFVLGAVDESTLPIQQEFQIMFVQATQGCSIPVSYQLEVRWTKYGTLLNPQAQIVKVMETIQTNTSTLPSTSTGGVISVMSSVSFIDMSQSASPGFRAPPTINANLPSDFFFPFV
ncbi:hypothetical protein QTP86_016866 [Hemibagrus guttatus]|nr:hypothetical protein QTP86_016866 [Hemibagrus guttatus]